MAECAACRYECAGRELLLQLCSGEFPLAPNHNIQPREVARLLDRVLLSLHQIVYPEYAATETDDEQRVSSMSLRELQQVARWWWCCRVSSGVAGGQ